MAESVALRLPSDPIHANYYLAGENDAGVSVVVVCGSGGGDDLSRALAKRLAREGFPALGLGYFKVPGRPPELRDVDLEYFVNAIAAVRSLTRDPMRRLVLLGSSRGSEAVQHIAALHPDLVQGVVALVPANECFGSWPPGGAAWTFEGAAVPNLPIAVEDIRCPMFLVSAGADEIWPSSTMARAVASRREGTRYETIHLDYPDATHALSFIAPTRDADGADDRARLDAWPQLLAFLRQVATAPNQHDL